MNIGHLIPGNIHQNYLLPETRPPQRWLVNWAFNGNHKMEVMRKILPPQPFPHLANLVDSELCVAAILKDADEGHPKNEPGPATEQKKGPVPTTPTTSPIWADDQGSGAGMRIDNEEFKSKQLPLLPIPGDPPAPDTPTAPKTAWWGETTRNST